MNPLFGKSPIDELRDLDYITNSHTFSKGVIAAYYNGLEYPMTIERDYNICIRRRKGRVFFELNPNIIKFEMVLDKDTVYSTVKSELCKVKTKEVMYNLDEIFTNPSKQVRRAMNLRARKEIGARVILSQDKETIDEIYEQWYLDKLADPKVYRIAFTPKRYKRSFTLIEKGFNIFDQLYLVNGQPYAAICYEVQGDIAFELAFISKYTSKELKITNDLNELILIDSFYQLYLKGIKRINVGPTAGIKGLKVFKNKLPHTYHEIYSN